MTDKELLLKLQNVRVNFMKHYTDDIYSQGIKEGMDTMIAFAEDAVTHPDEPKRRHPRSCATCFYAYENDGKWCCMSRQQFINPDDIRKCWDD